MKVAVVGGGPAGLYFAALAKRAHPDWQVRVAERNRADATFGFGVVLSGRALGFLADDDPETYRDLAPEMQVWDDFRIVHRDQSISIEGNGFSAIGRLELLLYLQRRCRKAGVELAFGREVRVLDEVAEADLVVGADGVNSTLRQGFGAEDRLLENRFVWYGTTRAFECLTLTFRRNADGAFVAHHYRYAPEMSTFVVECDAATFARAGLGAMSDAESRAYCEALFAADLDGRPLISNRSIWRRFPVLRTRRWQDGRRVLLGDALRTAHFSIGSGTRLAMEDAMALNRALAGATVDLPAALARFEADRRPPAESLAAAGAASAGWYERLPELMSLSPYALAHSYMMRTGRLDDGRLAELAPDFMRRCRAERQS